jgi:hypothetical protein
MESAQLLDSLSGPGDDTRRSCPICSSGSRNGGSERCQWDRAVGRWPVNLHISIGYDRAGFTFT